MDDIIDIDRIIHLLQCVQSACNSFGDHVRVRHQNNTAYLVPYSKRHRHATMSAAILTILLADEGFLTQTVPITSDGVVLNFSDDDDDDDYSNNTVFQNGFPCISPAKKKPRIVLEATEVAQIPREMINRAISQFKFTL